VYAIGQLSVYGISSNVLTTRLDKATSDLAQYCFEDSVQHLRGQSAHRLLMALALFVKSASQNAIAQIAFSDTNFNPRIHPNSQSLGALDQLYRLRLIVQHGERYDMHPLSREYALAELQSHFIFEQEARERWVHWYFQFSQPYKQQDWRQWHDYQDLDQEWENLQAVIDWCIHQNRYEEVKAFWQHVKGYTYVRGYWHERLDWIDWLLQEARERQDQTMIAEALGDKGWTLTLMVMGKPEQLAEVDALFEEQLSNLQASEDLSLQLELIYERVVLSIHQRKFDQTHQFLAQWRNLLQHAELEEAKCLCQRIRIDYYEAEVGFRTGNYQQAKIGYSSALEQARLAQWQQVEVYCLNWLADIALEGKGNYEEAEQLLAQSWPIAQQRKDRRSITFHQRSWANLEKMRGNISEFQRWATQAKQGFESLGMLAEAREMQSWLDE
ncbi:MAG: RNA polymerase subunit sigma-24, partial [Cyanobacteriota bacterium]